MKLTSNNRSKPGRRPIHLAWTCALGVLLGLISIQAQAQRVAYSQYMFNGMAINPAFAGSHGAISLTALNRWQWAGFDGAPITNTLSAHTPLEKWNVGAGLQFVRDEIGLTTENSLSLNYAYRAKMRKGTLAMGLLNSLSFFNVQLTEAVTNNPLDPVLEQDIKRTRANFGVGFLYTAPKFYVGISAPSLIDDEITNDGTTVFSRRGDYFFVGGVMLTVSRKLSLKPNFLVRASDGEPINYNVNLNALINEKVWIGLSVRPPESVNLLFEVQITEKMRLGYAMDYIMEKDLKRAVSSSHEFMINYKLPAPRLERVVCPAYF